MAMTRRGFLQVLGVAAASAAVFDVDSGLWVPQKPALAFHRDAFAMVMEPLALSDAAKAAIDEQLELNTLAQHFARLMADRLADHPAVLLHEVMFRHAGHVSLPPNTLDVTDHGIGRFTPVEGRCLMLPTELARKGFVAVELIANQMHAEIYRCKVDMFAPIGKELRPGDSFHDGMRIGLATEPETGLSVRVLRYGPDLKNRTMTAFEMAGGYWKPTRATRSAIRTIAALRALAEE